jgi:PAS domain S-box-containing protein
VQGFVGVARDLTEQRLAQAALAETAALLRDAEALAHAGRWLWDIASGAVQWSEEMHRIHGVDPVSFDGTLDAHLACVQGDDRAALRAALVASVESGRPLDVEYRIRRADGIERSIYARAEPTFGSAGAVVGLRGFAQDVTERRHAADHVLIGG